MPKEEYKSPSLFGRFVFVCILLFVGYLGGVHRESIADLTSNLSDTPMVQNALKSVKHISSKFDFKLSKFDFKIPRIEFVNPQSESIESSEPSDFLESSPSVESPKVDQIKLCSFNIRILSDKSRDDTELSYIAKILALYDIIAVQEVRDTRVMRRLISKLSDMGHDYTFDASPKVGNGVKEIYAFMWRKDKVKQLKRGKLYEDHNDEFIREPYYATFKAGDFDFTLLTIHLLFGKNATHRRPELVHLAEVYKYVQAKDPVENDVIVLGDFNFGSNDKGWTYLKNFDSMKYLVKSNQKTTVTDTSSYDNFWFQSSYTREYAGMYGIHKFDETMFNNDDRKAKIAVSDHRPIWAIFNTNDGDDD